MTTTRQQRCSSLDALIACASSAAPTDLPYNPESEIAREGSGNHAALRAIPMGEEPPVDQVAAEYGLDADDLRRMTGYGKKVWAEVGQWFPAPATEQPLENDLFRGTTDLISVMFDQMAEELSSLSVLDWKTGWGQREHPSQLMGYADCARSRYGMPASGYVLGVEAWVRFRTYRVHRFTAEQLDGFRARVTSQLERAGKQYGPGEHCQFCRHAHHCAARDEYLRATCAALAPIGETGITRAKLGELYEQSKALGAALRAYEKLLDAELAAGPIPLPGGRQLVKKEQEQDELDALKAWPVLLAGAHPLTAEQLGEVVSIGKGKLLEAVKAQASKGKGAAFQRETMQELAAAGAISKKTVFRKAIIDGDPVKGE